MKKIFIFCFIFYVVWQLTGRENTEPKEEPQIKEPIKEYPIGYCWERARDINQGDLDSLYEYGGKWYNKKVILPKPIKHIPTTKSAKQRAKEYDKKREEIGQQPLTQGDSPLYY